jgi:hypothetical protein
MLSVTYSQCHIQAIYSEHYYAECRYAECYYVECRAALKNLGLYSQYFISFVTCEYVQ